MAQDLKNAGPVIAITDVVRFGEKLVLPDGMSYATAINLIKSREEYDSKAITISDVFEVFPWDGAHALNTVLERKYGWAQAVATPGFFGDRPPQLISIEVGVNQTKMIPWGRFSLPNVDGHLQTDVTEKDGRMVFMISASIKRLHETQIRELFAEVRKEVAANSLYRGKAMKIRFKDDDGDDLSIPTLKFLDTSTISESMAIYPEKVSRAIQTNLFTPITRARDCIANGIPLKRGVLLGGTYGTGKTLAATIASKLAVDAGITYIYVPHADELSDAIEFARQYQSPACVVFCEDVDRVVSGERSVDMDDILNVIDGIDSKNSNIIVVLTSNDLNSINPAMLRPGRLDAVIEVTAPDALAVERLIRLYAGDALPSNANLNAAGKLLAGSIPAIVAEVVKRAKLAQLALQERGTQVRQLSEQAIIDAAVTMQSQVELLKRCMEPPTKDETLDTAMGRLVRKSLNGRAEHMTN